MMPEKFTRDLITSASRLPSACSARRAGRARGARSRAQVQRDDVNWDARVVLADGGRRTRVGASLAGRSVRELRLRGRSRSAG